MSDISIRFDGLLLAASLALGAAIYLLIALAAVLTALAGRPRRARPGKSRALQR